MSIVDRDGIRVMARPVQKLRGDAARDRDRLLYWAAVQHGSQEYAASLFRIDPALACRRIQAMPEATKAGIRRQIASLDHVKKEFVKELVKGAE